MSFGISLFEHTISANSDIGTGLLKKMNTMPEVVIVLAMVFTVPADVPVPVLAPVRVRAAAEQDVPLRIFTALSSKAGGCAPDFGRRQERNELRETI